ncbi:MAG TPA: hypothetical protein VI688_08975 [Anaerolineales bacterium]|nr:hypothetical protein [Anaerolineales bacterium]
MKIHRLAVLFAALALASLACGVGSLLPSGSTGLNTTTELWSDVPRMDGLEGSDLALPLTARIFMEAWMSAVLSGGTGNADVAVFSTQKSATDIQGFYTNERMVSNGWEASEETTCFTGEEQGVEDVGLFCVFIKEATTAETGLMLIAVPGEDSGQLEVFFVRIENQVTPTP